MKKRARSSSCDSFVESDQGAGTTETSFWFYNFVATELLAGGSSTPHSG
jgi:hypothetical protein